MLLVVFGPPAVGKMTVGRAVCAASGFRLFHNHMTIEPLLETFGHGTRAFNRLNSEFRQRVLQEAAADGMDLVFSVVWALDNDDDLRLMREYCEIFAGQVAFVELRADLATRLQRNHTEPRLLHKASKRDLAWSDGNLRDMEGQGQMTSAAGPALAGELLTRQPHLVLETAGLDAEQTAWRVLDWLPQARASLPAPRWSARRDQQLPRDVARLLASVPEWFGLPEANQSYVEDARSQETWSVRSEDGTVLGVALVQRRFGTTAEITLMVVDRARHGQGVGTALVRSVEASARQEGLRLLQVKTLGDSHPDVGYGHTRAFYRAMGFLPLEETDLWGEMNPCLFLVKPL